MVSLRNGVSDEITSIAGIPISSPDSSSHLVPPVKSIKAKSENNSAMTYTKPL